MGGSGRGFISNLKLNNYLYILSIVFLLFEQNKQTVRFVRRRSNRLSVLFDLFKIQKQAIQTTYPLFIKNTLSPIAIFLVGGTKC